MATRSALLPVRWTRSITGYVAKRMEIGAVVGATPASHVRRECPAPGDVIVLLGGRTGRDGVGGATGSSKAHKLDSLEHCGAEVQKATLPSSASCSACSAARMPAG